jgi:hypothetical protein
LMLLAAHSQGFSSPLALRDMPGYELDRLPERLQVRFIECFSESQSPGGNESDLCRADCLHSS